MGLNDDRAEVALHPGSMVEVSGKFSGEGAPTVPGIVLERSGTNSWLILVATTMRGVKTLRIFDSEVFEHVRIQPPEFVLHTKPWSPPESSEQPQNCPHCGSSMTDRKLRSMSLEAYKCLQCSNQFWVTRGMPR